MGSLERYRRSNFDQKAVLMFSVALMSFLFLKEYLVKPFNYVDEKAHESEMTQIAKDYIPETEEYLLDTPRVEKATGIVNPYLNGQEDFDNEDAVSYQQGEYRIVEMDVLEMEADPEYDQEAYVSDENGEAHTSYNCERFYNFRGTIYMIQDNVFPSIERAQARIAQLKRHEILSNCLWLGCFTKAESGYVVYYDLLYDNYEEAKDAIQDYRAEIKKLKLIEGDIVLRALANNPS